MAYWFRQTNSLTRRGANWRRVSRAESLDIILGKSSHAFSEQEKSDMMARKNHCYQGLLSRLSPADILPGVEEFLSGLEGVHIPMAIGSSSKNAPLILEKVGLSRRFKAVADGNLISRSKPDPEVFLLAAQLLMMDPRDCLVVEDAVAGIEAANRAGMKVLGLGHGTEKSTATYHAPSLAGVNPLEYLA